MHTQRCTGFPVAGTGFAPVTSWLWATRATELRHPAMTVPAATQADTGKSRTLRVAAVRDPIIASPEGWTLDILPSVGLTMGGHGMRERVSHASG